MTPRPRYMPARLISSLLFFILLSQITKNAATCSAADKLSFPLFHSNNNNGKRCNVLYGLQVHANFSAALERFQSEAFGDVCRGIQKHNERVRCTANELYWFKLCAA